MEAACIHFEPTALTRSFRSSFHLVGGRPTFCFPIRDVHWRTFLAPKYIYNIIKCRCQTYFSVYVFLDGIKLSCYLIIPQFRKTDYIRLTGRNNPSNRRPSIPPTHQKGSFEKKMGPQYRKRANKKGPVQQTDPDSLNRKC